MLFKLFPVEKNQPDIIQVERDSCPFVFFQPSPHIPHRFRITDSMNHEQGPGRHATGTNIKYFFHFLRLSISVQIKEIDLRIGFEHKLRQIRGKNITGRLFGSLHVQRSNRGRTHFHNRSRLYPVDQTEQQAIHFYISFNSCFLSRSEEHTSELQSRQYLVCRLLLEKKKTRSCSRLSRCYAYRLRL